MLVHVGQQVDDLGGRAVLGDVEAGELSGRVDAEREAPVDERENDEADAECPGEAHADADKLDPDPLGSAVRDRKRLDVAEQADGERPPDPGPEVHGHRPTASSIRSRSRSSVTSRMTTAATPPTSAAFHGLMMSAEAVMPTSPASAEFMIAMTGRGSRAHVMVMPTTPPKAAARVVFRITDGTSAVSPRVLPPLKPYQPIQSTNTPTVVSGRSWPRIGTAPAPNRPILGPRMMIAERHPAADGMDDGRSGEVDEAELLEPAARAALAQNRRIAPRPVTEDGVDDRRDEDGEDEVAGEPHPLRDRTRDQCRGRGDEPELEHEERRQERPVVFEQERRRADDAGRARAEHQPESEQPEERGRDQERCEVLEGDVDRVLRAQPSCFRAR